MPPALRLLSSVLLLLALPAVAQERPRNLVLFIGDGFGPAYAELARGVSGAPLALDALLVGGAQTAPTDARVTESAAGATAYACGLKTYNGAIAVDPAGRPCRTLLEAAEARGMATGLVATSRITHATPAAFAAHVPDRDLEEAIAAQMAGSGVDVLFGGGARFFQPDALRGSRTDERDLLRELSEQGYTVVTDPGCFSTLDVAPAAALLAPDHLAYELDRDETAEPSLAEMTRKALDLLAASDAGRAEGFFLMVEGSRIDHAGHGNDPAAAAADVLAYDAAVAAALAWARADGRTLVVGVADHETGGLSLGRDGVYDWQPAVLAAATESADRMAARIGAGATPAAVLRTGAGIDSLTAEETAALAAAGDAAYGALVRVVSARAGVGWTTGGHTAVDVSVYAAGPGAARFSGSRPNDAVGRLLFEVLGLEPGE
jgi:alkaline phosphatase